jgi:hypothetical protein
LSFEANQGQTDAQVRFLARGAGYTLFLTASEAVIRLRNADFGSRRDRLGADRPLSTIRNSPASVLRMRLVGAQTAPQIEGQDQLPGQHNYFTGKDQKQWHTGVPSYARVRYTSVYPALIWSITARADSSNMTSCWRRAPTRARSNCNLMGQSK